MRSILNRRDFATGLSLAGAAGLLLPQPALADAPLETTTVRFGDISGGGICIAPQYVADALLRADGITDIRNVPVGINSNTPSMMAEDRIDFAIDFASLVAVGVDRGMPIKALAGVHPGCYALFAHEGIESIIDLRGKSVGVGPYPASDPQVFVSAMATYVGLDPVNDINWIQSEVSPLELFVERKIDALLTFPPEVQELRARKIGHVVVDGALDRPWSQYFCCLVLANPAYVEKHPAATKRVLRAVLKAADICVAESEMVLRLLADRGFDGEIEYAASALRDIPYARWREYDPEDTIRFFSLRLHEAGIIKSSPQKIIANGTDWSFLNELKRELKT